MKVCKICKICELIKPFDEFYTNGKQHSGKQKYKPACRSCEISGQTERFWDIVKSFYGSLSCSRCGYNTYRGALEMHHRDPRKKDKNPSDMKTYTANRIVSELEKCDLLCSNCHREVHNQMNGVWRSG